VIVLDTSILSLAFRRSTAASATARTLQRLIEDDEPLAVPGIVLQELLSGIREPAQCERLREILAGFPLLLASQAEHVSAARIAKDCRRAGIATATPDCLISALSIGRNARLMTTDRDFVHMAEHCELQLYELTHSR